MNDGKKQWNGRSRSEIAKEGLDQNGCRTQAIFYDRLSGPPSALKKQFTLYTQGWGLRLRGRRMVMAMAGGRTPKITTYGLGRDDSILVSSLTGVCMIQATKQQSGLAGEGLQNLGTQKPRPKTGARKHRQGLFEKNS